MKHVPKSYTSIVVVRFWLCSFSEVEQESPSQSSPVLENNVVVVSHKKCGYQRNPTKSAFDFKDFF